MLKRNLINPIQIKIEEKIIPGKQTTEQGFRQGPGSDFIYLTNSPMPGKKNHSNEHRSLNQGNGQCKKKFYKRLKFK